jgi:tetratricopeptide (TPR) repeat protein
MDAETAYLFRHAVLRDAVYQLMLPGVRSELHAKVVDAADAGPGLCLAAREVANHARAAQHDAAPGTAARMRERERHWLRIAQQTAHARSDLAAAVQILERLFELLRGTPEELDARISLACALRETGNLQRAEQMLGDAGREPPSDPVLASRLQGALASVYIRTGRLREAAALQDRLLEAHRAAGDESAVAESLGMLGVTHYHLGDFERAEACYRQALSMGARGTDDSRLARFTANLALLLADAGRFDEAEHAQREAVRLAELADDRLALANSLGNYALLLTNLSRHAEAEHMYQRALQLEREIGHIPGYAVALANLGRLLRLQGRFDEAERLLREAADLHHEVASSRNEGSALGQLADLFAAQGRFDESLEYFGRGIDLLAGANDVLYEGVLRTGRGRLRLLLTDLAGARQDLSRATDLLGGSTPEAYRLYCLYPLQAYVAAAALAEGASLTWVIAEVQRAVARYEQHPEVTDVRDIKGLLHELQRAQGEGGPPRLHCGCLPSLVAPGALQPLLARLEQTNPSAAENLRRLLKGQLRP